MTSFYNENDKNCVDLLQRQVANGSLPSGYVDSRSIEEIQPNDIKQYNEAHFFAGIGGFALGFARAGIPNDTTVWTGGFPCQDLSVAGKRAGLAGKRSGLYFEFHRLITANYPKWVVLENVPGLLSSNEGKDFAIVIGGLTGIIPNVPQEGWGNAGFARGPVYNVAYRVLDAQYFGVPQRRRRVFIVGSLGDGRATEVLFEREGVQWDTPPSREAGKDVAYSLRSNPSHSGDKGDGGINSTLLSFMPRRTQMDVYENVSPTMHTGGGGMGMPAISYSVPTKVRHNAATDGETLIPYIISTVDDRRADRPNGGMYVNETDLGNGISSKSDVFALSKAGVRRLTPTECERLQGFPDGWTDGQTDTPRYRQLGNAVAVPCAEWIGRRIMETLT